MGWCAISYVGSGVGPEGRAARTRSFAAARPPSSGRARNASPWPHGNADLDPLFELGKDRHHPIDGEAIDLRVANARKIRSGDAGEFFGGSIGD